MAPSCSVLSLTARRAPFRAAAVVDAPPGSVHDAIVAVETWTRAGTAAGRAFTVVRGSDPSDALVPGDVVGVGGRRRALYRVAATSPGSAEEVRLEGVGAVRRRSIVVTATATGAGSLVTGEVRGGRGRRRVRTLRRLQLLLGVITLVATGDGRRAAAQERLQDGGAAPVVVAGVVVRDGAILAARRTYPPELAGRWECPGGKVDPGESETDALVREFEEELGIAVAAGGRVGPEIEIGHGYVLHAYRADLISGEPSPSVHDAVRWVTASEIDSLAWLPSDAPLIPALRELLADRGGRSGRTGGGAAGIAATGA